MSTVLEQAREAQEPAPGEETTKRRRIGPASLIIFLVLIAAFVAPTQPTADPDTWWHLRTGEVILETGIPSTDPFSWTAEGRQWTAHEWGSQAILAVIDAALGPRGLLLLAGLLVGAAFVLVRKTLRLVTRNDWIIAGALVAALCFSTITWSIRPHLFSILFFSLFLWVLVLHRAGQPPRLIWMLVPATAVWVNLHGAFVSGVLLLWIFGIVGLIERHPRSRQLLAVAIAATAAGVLNPSGLAIYLHPLHVARVSGEIGEWQATGTRDVFGILFTIFVLSVPALLALTKRKPEYALLGATLIFAAMGLGAVKNVWMAGIVGAVTLAAGLQASERIPRSRDAKDRERWLLIGGQVALSAAAVAFVWLNFAGGSESQLRGESEFPRGAAEALATMPEGRMINPYNWGGYLIWKLPDVPVSIDGRNDMYGEDLLRRQFRIEEFKPGTLDLLDRHDVTYVLTQRDRPIAEGLRHIDGWKVAHQDRLSILFARD
jgi:hypothetical protein